MDQCPEARVSPRVVATLLGSSSLFSSDVADSSWLHIRANPWLDGVSTPFEVHRPITGRLLGPGSIHLYADVSSTSLCCVCLQGS